MSAGDDGEVRHKSRPLDEGDIVALMCDRTCVIHRFCGRRTGGGFFHRGDMGIIPAVTQPEDIVIGRLVTICHGSRCLNLEHSIIRTLSSVFVRITRLEAEFLKRFNLGGTHFEKAMMVWHRIWNVILWSFCWWMLSYQVRD